MLVLLPYRRRRQRGRRPGRHAGPRARTDRPRGRVMTESALGRVVMVIPTYNEADNLAWIVGRLRARGAVGRRAGRRRQLTGRHRRARRRAGRRRPGRARAAPARQGRSRGGVPRRVRVGARRRLRRHRGDGRRRLAPARAAAPAAGGAARRRPGDRVAVGPGRLGGQLAAAPRGALAGRQPLRAAAARHRDPGRHGGLPGLPAQRAGEDRPGLGRSPPATSSRPTW